jgi:hypothetical protein
MFASVTRTGARAAKRMQPSLIHAVVPSQVRQDANRSHAVCDTAVFPAPLAANTGKGGGRSSVAGVKVWR